ncbi:Hypothetical protein NGAL_HAMBI1145_55360 [Neorhizobium galegae bv. officinalis]|uniref:Uncharacterized protein n=1 Tax=Neorhizobium galegae bv. officinalis TaxID=323656 RepID=A0A0T7G0F7_NEOGA|nr:Hypothetical protein NGAL_HAMBI1145_55360 [Neorhizobium galegae bv. officinalis]CDZ53627.1 Hypothetical protein NGAL_HAMBI1189_50910 [Neorhizobium galegae bv. officinalis]
MSFYGRPELVFRIAIALIGVRVVHLKFLLVAPPDLFRCRVG